MKVNELLDHVLPQIQKHSQEKVIQMLNIVCLFFEQRYVLVVVYAEVVVAVAILILGVFVLGVVIWADFVLRPKCLDVKMNPNRGVS